MLLSVCIAWSKLSKKTKLDTAAAWKLKIRLKKATSNTSQCSNIQEKIHASPIHVIFACVKKKETPLLDVFLRNYITMKLGPDLPSECIEARLHTALTQRDSQQAAVC